MDEFSCFAMYFNLIAWLFHIDLWFLKYYLVQSVVFLLFFATLSILASQMLLRTISLRFSDHTDTESQETLLPPPFDEPRSTLSLPFLLRCCTPKTFCGGLLYTLFLSLVIIILLKIAIQIALNLYFVLYDMEFSRAGIGLTFAGAAGVIVLCPFPIMARFHPLFMCVNLLSAVFGTICTVHFFSPRKISTFEVANIFSVFFELQLIIPSVISASNIPAHRHSRLLIYAICGVSVLFLALGGFIAFDARLDLPTQNTFYTWLFGYRIAPTLFIGEFAIIHLLTRALSDIIVAWRYGLNVKVANQDYPKRVRATHILIPVLIFALGYFLAPVEVDLWQLWALSSLLTEGVALLILPYCYEVAERRMILGDRTLWWKYVVYVGGVAVVLATAAELIFGEHDALKSFGLDAGIFAALLLWQFFGRFFS